MKCEHQGRNTAVKFKMISQERKLSLTKVKIMKVKKKILVLLLILLLTMLISCNDAPDETLFTYEETEAGFAVAATQANSGTVRIPAEYKGKPVVAIKESAFYKNEFLRELIIPSTVKEIGSYAFSDCIYLKSVTFEEGGSCNLADSSFEGCTLLSKLDFNGSVKNIGENSFKNCKKISFLKIGKEVKSIGQDAFMNCERLLLNVPENSVIYEYALENHLCMNFFDSVYADYLKIIGAVGVAGAIAAVLLNIGKKKKEN